jgi:hypothetical protein
MAMEIGQIQDVMLLYTMHYLFSNKKKKGYLKFSQLNVSSLRRGHANLLCIVPNLNCAKQSFTSAASKVYTNLILIVKTTKIQERLMIPALTSKVLSQDSLVSSRSPQRVECVER